jgi:hypothetical protein
MKYKFAILSFLTFFFNPFTSQGQTIELSKIDTSELRNIYKNFNYVPDSGYVNSKETAIKIATVILESIYGEAIKGNFPLDAVLVENNTIWVVIGTKMKGAKGGIPYIEIRKKDGQILKVAHSK